MKRVVREGIISPVIFEDVYAYVGMQSVKFIIDPARSQDIDSVKVSMFNSDGLPMDFTYKRWGTKLNLSFKIDHETPDGVSIIDVLLSGRNFGEVKERFDLWIIK